MSDWVKSGGGAFPSQMKGGDGLPMHEGEYGLTVRDYLAAHAPIDYATVCSAWGSPEQLCPDDRRAGFMAVWAMLRYEYADAMLRAREEAPRA